MRLRLFRVVAICAGNVGCAAEVLGIISVPDLVLPFTYATLMLWFAIRGYTIGKIMGWKHAIACILASYHDCHSEFCASGYRFHKGRPEKFEVIRKE